MMGASGSLAVFMLIAGLCNSQLVVDYSIVPYSGDLSRLATLVWLRPAHCLFETWAAQRSDWMVSPHSSISIVVDILREVDNGTFALPHKYPVPRCNYFSSESPEAAYQMGPRIVCKNGSCIEEVLPGQAFRIRYILQDMSGKSLIQTRWSDSILTRNDPPSYLSIQVWDAGMRSGNMIVITVLLTTALLILVVGFAATIAAGWK
ncbi:uncharacterized protein LOC127585665 isoform X1 [Pristis pectinata]|uniref:uncharacterized protein LOC127585665 isoform X1 n=1 Tax=Pristis pectinata TaxID=685728 RepID=UPI00223D02B7|nr:uncharacterized protein LOC127585665 isoform X1 [Pristis pectinata]